MVMTTMKDLILDLINRVIAFVYNDDVSIPELNYRDHNLETSQEYDLTLTAYALGWKEGLEAGMKAVYALGNGIDARDIEQELTPLSLTPWPEHPEYGWKSEGARGQNKSKVDVIDNLTSQLNNLKCDTCGKPATSMARDVILIDNPTSTINSYKPSNTIKLGCGEHPVESNTVIGTSPLQPVYDCLDELYATREILENCRCAIVPLDCQGLGLNSSTGKIDSFMDPVSSGSDSWTGADDDLNNFTGGHTV